MGSPVVTFVKLNHGWNAEPSVPLPTVAADGEDLLLKFVVNPYMFQEFREGELGILRFVEVEKYRLGDINDEGWYLGQCRFSKLAPEWGEFYRVVGPASLLDAPTDWQILGVRTDTAKHYVFYFRDDMFECVAHKCVIVPVQENSLFRMRRRIDEFEE